MTKTIDKKIIVIGDLHGHDTWRKVFNKYGLPKKDKLEWIILGDYFDSFSISPDECRLNFSDLMRFKEIMQEAGQRAVTTLLGNHDFHYLLNDGEEQYSGFNNGAAFGNQMEIEKHAHNLDIIHSIPVGETDLVFSHAGLTNYWVDNVAHGIDRINEWIDLFLLKLDERLINNLRFNYEKGYNPYGDTISNGPLWVRPKSLCLDPYMPDISRKCIQFVGHTAKTIKTGDDSNWRLKTVNDNVDLILCDTANYVTIIDIYNDDSFEIRKENVYT